jgi:hypothetical protein
MLQKTKHFSVKKQNKTKHFFKEDRVINKIKKVSSINKIIICYENKQQNKQPIQNGQESFVHFKI